MTPDDAAALVLAVLLHDLAMHLTFDGFRCLVGGQGRPGEQYPLAPFLDSKTWSEMWAEYLAETKRWDSRKRIAVFGEDASVSEPPEDEGKLTLRDRLLIGDFLRRGHPRLGHEIAIAGFPGREGRVVMVPADCPESLRGVAGLVARSHGMPLRAAVQALEHFHKREYQKIHAGFLMVVLRIADYLQVDADRAPSQHLQVSTLKSPVSLGEWKAHSAVRNISLEEEDPEAIYIDAQPRDVRTFLRLKNLLAGLQAEMDTSWAVLGELYGRYPRLRDLAIDLRRVRSNLDDLAKFAKTVDYIPTKASFEAVNPDLLKLLIEPLYGDDPHVGVRELIQNAVDACGERDDILSHFNAESAVQFERLTSDVELRLKGDDEHGWTLTVADHGVGMTAETVLQYFLRAGSTYRSSDEWRRRHTSDTKGSKSRVLRSGRFGIGVLAAFLLGEKLRVETRHLLAAQDGGVAFEASLDTEEIELKRITRPAGTTIEIELRATAAAALLAAIRSTGGEFRTLPRGPYLLAKPSVQLVVNKEIIQRGNFWPSEGRDLPPAWHRLRVSQFADVHWSYLNNRGRFAGARIALNGLALTELKEELGYLKGKSGRVLRPDVSIFDRDARLGITLDRRKLTESKLPFDRDLLLDVTRDLIASLLLCPESIEEFKWHFDYPGLWEHMLFAHSRQGYSLVHPALFSGDQSWHALEVEASLKAEWKEIFSLLPRAANACLIPSFSVRAKGQEYLALTKDERPWALDLQVDRLRIFVPSASTANWRGTRTARDLLKLKTEWKGSEWISLVADTKEPPLINPERLEPALQRLDKGGALVAVEYHIRSTLDLSVGKHPFWRLVHRYLAGNPWIPYSLTKRREQLSKAFRELEPYIQKHLAVRSMRPATKIEE